MTPYARILMLDRRPTLRVVSEYTTNETPLSAANLFLLMKDGFAALTTLAQSGVLPGFIDEAKP